MIGGLRVLFLEKDVYEASNSLGALDRSAELRLGQRSKLISAMTL